MKSNRYFIIADDITGSNDSGVQLKRRGIDTIVTLDSTSVGVQKISYVLNTESRSLKGEDAFNLVNRSVSKIKLHEFDHVIKKVDSTLRGSIAHEISAVDEVFSPELIVFMPALPDLGRTTINGQQLLQGTPITKTEIANDPKTPVTQDNLQKLLEEVYNEPVNHIDLASIEDGKFSLSGGRIFSFDAKTNSHMKTVIDVSIKTGKRVLWVGTAGIVDNLLEIEDPQLPVVALIASLSETTRRQVHYAQEQGTEVVVVPTKELIQKERNPKDVTQQIIVDKVIEIIQSRRDVIVISDASYDRLALNKLIEAGITDNRTIAEESRVVQKQMGEIISKILERSCVAGVFLSGGDTAMGFLNAIDATGLFIVSEVLIGIPLMQIVGGKHQNMKVITKAGAFGKDDALSFCLRKLKEKIKI